LTNIQAAYDEDFFTWTQDQARAIRSIPQNAVGNSVDLEHIAEEIEDLGNSLPQAVESFLKRLFEHLLKLVFYPDSTSRDAWLGECDNFQDQAFMIFRSSMTPHVDIQRAWRRGSRLATNALTRMNRPATIVDECPFSLNELLVENFDVEAALAKLEEAHRNQPTASTSWKKF
jgi:Domain of unknown function DUF29